MKKDKDRQRKKIKTDREMKEDKDRQRNEERKIKTE